MTLLKGINIILINKIQNGVDAFGHPIFEDKEIIVKNVLVAPASTDDITNSVNLTGKKAEYTIGIPKGDVNAWENREVLFFGKKRRTIGIPQEGIEAMIPLDWNKKVMVERFE
ncbi:hypothetical protein ACWOBZ_01065 [Gemella bergeri]